MNRVGASVQDWIIVEEVVVVGVSVIELYVAASLEKQ